MNLRGKPAAVRAAYFAKYAPDVLSDERLELATIDGLEEAGFTRDLLTAVPEVLVLASPGVKESPHDESYYAMTLAEIGAEIGCGPERVRGIIMQALWKIRRSKTLRPLLIELVEDSDLSEDFLDDSKRSLQEADDRMNDIVAGKFIPHDWRLR